MHDIEKQSHFSLFRSLFYDVMRHIHRFEREVLRVLHEYSMQVSEVSDTGTRLEMIRDFAIYYSRYARLRQKLFVLQSRVEQVVILFRMELQEAFDVAQSVYHAYNKWYLDKEDFIKSFLAARLKWDNRINDSSS